MKHIFLKTASATFFILNIILIEEVRSQAPSLKTHYDHHQTESTIESKTFNTEIAPLPDNTNCRKIQKSNGFENGFDIQNNIKIADDIKLSSNILSFSVESIKTNLVNDFGTASVSIYFYEDNNGQPGNLLASSLDLVPSSQTDIGGTFGFNVFETIIDLPTPIVLTGNGSGEVTYWFRIGATPESGDTFVAWESTSVITNSPLYFDSDQNDVDNWSLGQVSEDMVFEIIGNCTYIDICLPISNLQLKDRSNDTATFVWDINEPAEKGYIIEIYGDEEDPQTNEPVFTANVVQGINTATITGLQTIVEYDFYIKSDCGAEGVSETVKLDFRSSVPDPVCGGVFYDTGGPNEEFGFNEDITYKIMPDVPGQLVTVQFSLVALEPPFDVLTIDVGDGNIIEVPNVNVLNNDVPLRYTSIANDGSLVFRFKSNDIVALDGWEATVSCALPATCKAPDTLVNLGGTGFINNFTWDVVENATQGYILSIFEFGVNPDTATPITTEEIATGNTSGRLEGLEANTNYLACVQTNCGVDDGQSIYTCRNIKTGPPPVFCGDMFFDLKGEFQPYENNESYSLLIENNNPSEVLGIQFLDVDIEEEFDFLRIYDGSDTTGNELSGRFGILEPGVFYSDNPGGDLFITFTSDQSGTEDGWKARIVCTEAGNCRKPSDLTHAVSSDTATEFSWRDTADSIIGYTMDIYPNGANIAEETTLYSSKKIRRGTTQIEVNKLLPNMSYDVYFRSICSNRTVSAPYYYSYRTAPSAPSCGGIFTDTNVNPNPFLGVEDYDNNERHSYTITPNTRKEIITLDFTFVDIELGYDFLRIYDGPDATFPELTGGNGLEINGTYSTTVPGRPMYITFMSDESIAFGGWEALVKCENAIGNSDIIRDGSKILFNSNNTIKKSAISILPNPFSGSIHIEASNPLETIVIYDLVGHEVFRKRLTEAKEELNLSFLKGGMYLARLTSGRKEWVRKIVKN